MSRSQLNFGKYALRRQRGATTLLVTMIFLFSTSIVMLYLNRNILFEQKIAANQMRSTQALEMAEAGIEWATGMLNTPYDITADCVTLTTATTPFRKIYVQTMWNDAVNPSTNVIPATTSFPGCKVDATGALHCNCPTPPSGTTTISGYAATVLPSFSVAFSAIASDPEAVQVTSTGCTAQAGVCTPSTAGSSDATATVTATLKLRALLRSAPAAPLTCGTTCAVGGSMNIVNTDAATGGILVNAGGAITQANGTSYTSIPGQPTQNALVGNDATLSSLSASDPTCSNSTVFSAYFGSTISQYANSPEVTTISCSSASDCGTQVNTAYNAPNGKRSFYFPLGFTWNNSSGTTLGTLTDPVTIVTPSAIKINGNINIYGMIFANDANINDLGTGASDVHGALVTCAAYSSNGNGTIEYDATVLTGVRRSTGSLVRVPGSWSDRCTLSTASPPVLTCN